jgi:hypothetical protein
MINHIAKETKLLRFVLENKIAEVDKIIDVQQYKIDDDRKGLIVEVKERKIEGTTKILIDLKQGQPTINQVYDSLYGIGEDCDMRVIIHTNGHNDNDNGIPSADVWAVLSLISELQNRDIDILLCKYDEITFNIEYIDLYQDWSNPYRCRKVNLPTREQFIAQTFWSVYFDSQDGNFYEPSKAYWERFRDMEDWGAMIYIDTKMKGEIRVYWNENGVRYEVKQCNDSDEYLKKVLDFEMPALKKRYGEGAVEFENVIGRLPRLYIRYSDKPFCWLYSATPRQITEFAENLACDAWGLRREIDETEERLFEMDFA